MNMTFHLLIFPNWPPATTAAEALARVELTQEAIKIGKEMGRELEKVWELMIQRRKNP